MEQLRVDVRERGGWTVVVLVGELDVATAPRLRSALVEAQRGHGRRVVIDLDGLEFLDSFGIGVVVGALKRAGERQGELALVATRARLLRLLELTRLDEIVPVASTVDDILDD